MPRPWLASRPSGEDLIDLKDPDDKAFVKERVEIALKQGSGWQNCKILNPTTKHIEPRTVDLERVDSLLFACRVYAKP